MKNHNVILYVDTKSITKKNINSTTSFDPNDMTCNNHDFKTTVSTGDYITWLGVSISDPNDKVIIKKIKHDSKSNIFGRKNLRESCCPNSGKVIGTVGNNTGGKTERYEIHFQVCDGNNGGIMKKLFIIDPQIEVDP